MSRQKWGLLFDRFTSINSLSKNPPYAASWCVGCYFFVQRRETSCPDPSSL